MSLNSVVNKLVRAAASVPEDISDSDLDQHVARLLTEEAKANDVKWSELGLGAFLGSNSRDLPDPSLPKPNKRFLASVIRSVDSHNTALIREQAQSARDAREARDPREARRGASGASRLFGGALGGVRRDAGRRADRESGNGEASSRRDAGSTRRADRDNRAASPRRIPREDKERYSDRRDRSRSRSRDRRRDDSDDDHKRPKRSETRRGYESDEGRRERRRGKDDYEDDREHRRAKDERSRRDKEHRRDDRDGRDGRDHREQRRDHKYRDRSVDKSGSRHRPERSPSPLSSSTRHSRPRSPNPQPSRTPSPGPEPISRMDKYFKKSYDPRFDVGEVPKDGLVTAVGWDNMLAVLKDRGKKRRRNSPGLSRSPEPERKSRLESSSRKTTTDSSSRSEMKGLMDMEYVPRGGMRAWDEGK